MLAAIEIIAGVVLYRLRKLEMANLAGAVTIAVALRLPWIDVLCRTFFAFVLNVLVYLNNDYVDIGLDLRSADKDAHKTGFLAAHLRAAFWLQWALLALLFAAALVYDRGLLAPLIAGGGICLWYSVDLKGRPYLDIPAMMLWGMMMPLCGAPVTSILGLCLAMQLGLFSGVFETIQVMRDADQDAAEGVRTTGVVLGKARASWLTRGLMLVCSIYALLVAEPLAAIISALALLIPLSSQHVERYWTHVKLVYGVAWLVLCGRVLLEGHSAGLLWSVSRAAGLWRGSS